jgi:uncharacterized protein (TIGR02266 family)
LPERRDLTARPSGECVLAVERDLRRFSRKAIHLDFRGESAEGIGHLLFEGADLSAGGTFLKSDLLLEQGESLALEFRLPRLSKVIRAQARVAWVRRFPKNHEVPGMGIEFSAMADDDRSVIAQYLDSFKG